jgi:uncharacterized cupin superfamily protein
VITHWDEIDGHRRERGHIAASWQPLTGAHSVTVGVQRIAIDPGHWATPLHLEGSEEEIFYVLSGTGVSVQWDGEKEQAFAVGPGDCLVHLALEHAHTIGAGEEELVVLAFGQRHYAANTLLPRAGVSWLGSTWVLEGAPEDHPWQREAAVGPPTWEELSDRPSRILNVHDVDEFEHLGGTVARRGRDLGRAAGSERTGLRVYDVEPGKLMNAPHSHSAEEEIFVVLGGGGIVTVWPHPRAIHEPGRWEGGTDTHEIRTGHTIASPAGTGRPLSLQAGTEGMRVLAYGTRDPNDITYYPRSGKICFRGVGVIGRIEQADYWDGED